MLWLLLLVPVISLLIYFRYFDRASDEVWQVFRRRKRDRLLNPPPEEPSNPDFQFDRPSSRDADEGSITPPFETP
jgi:hypothetical protein